MVAFMPDFFERLDDLAGIAKTGVAPVWLERVAFVFLAVTVAAAPHSIATTTGPRSDALT